MAAYLAAQLEDDRVERRARHGSKDRGDIGGVRTLTGGRMVIEVKDTTRLELGQWIAETEIERGNDDALAGVVVHKRRGKGSPGDWYVTMAGRDLVALLTGERPA